MDLLLFFTLVIFTGLLCVVLSFFLNERGNKND